MAVLPTRSSTVMSTTPSDLWQETDKVFQDSVHGSIALHDLLMKIINTPEFQRLRNIKQVAMTNYVYPAASHTRFEHCIGVAYLAGRMLRSLEDNSDPEIMKNVTKEEKLCVLIAGLCHDIGHGPFSHTWEVFLQFAAVERGSGPDNDIDHERISARLFRYMLEARDGQLMEEFRKYNLGEREITLIEEFIDGGGKTLGPNKHFLYSIVSDSEYGIDVDKWDYFLRDGLSLGLTVSFDYQRLLHFTKVEMKDGRSRIIFRDKEIISLKDMFELRAQLHLRAYQHPVARKLEAMLLDALLEADNNWKMSIKGDEVRLSEAHKNMDHFSQLGDFVINMIKCSNQDNLKVAQRILERIELRDLYQDLGSWEIEIEDNQLVPTPGFLHEVRRNIRTKYNVNVFPTLININTGKHKNPTDRLYLYKKEKPETPRRYPDSRRDFQFAVVLAFCREKITEERKEEIQRFISDHLKGQFKIKNDENVEN